METAQKVISIRTKYLGRALDAWAIVQAYLPDAKLLSGNHKYSIRIEISADNVEFLSEVLAPLCWIEDPARGSFCDDTVLKMRWSDV